MNDLSEKYKHASSEKERMAICIQAIDQELICRGCSIEAFDNLFGTRLNKKVPGLQEIKEEGRILNYMGRGRVDFNENPPSPSDDVQAVETGWYVWVEFDYRGLIQDYYLSNLHK